MSEGKNYEVSQCSGDICPFKINGVRLYCRINGARLNATVYPLPENCPLKNGRIVVALVAKEK